MNYIVEKYNIIELKNNEKILSKLSRLTLRKHEINDKSLRSVMKGKLKDILESSDDKLNKSALAFIARQNGFIYGWGLLYTYEYISDTKMLNVYIDERYRRNGIGSKIFNMAKEYCGKMEYKMFISPWNKTSYSFYNKLDNLSRKRGPYYVVGC